MRRARWRSRSTRRPRARRQSRGCRRRRLAEDTRSGDGAVSGSICRRRMAFGSARQQESLEPGSDRRDRTAVHPARIPRKVVIDHRCRTHRRRRLCGDALQTDRLRNPQHPARIPIHAAQLVHVQREHGRTARLIGRRCAVDVQTQHLAVERTDVARPDGVAGVVDAQIQLAIGTEPEGCRRPGERRVDAIEQDGAFAERVAEGAVSGQSEAVVGRVHREHISGLRKRRIDGERQQPAFAGRDDVVELDGWLRLQFTIAHDADAARALADEQATIRSDCEVGRVFEPRGQRRRHEANAVGGHDRDGRRADRGHRRLPDLNHEAGRPRALQSLARRCDLERRDLERVSAGRQRREPTGAREAVTSLRWTARRTLQFSRNIVDVDRESDLGQLSR